MRASKGCKSCRTRHTKCVTKEGQSSCTRCQESKRKCIFDPIWRFRQVEHVDTASQGVRSRTDLVYDTAQPWVSTQEIVAFVSEDGIGNEGESIGAVETRHDPANDTIQYEERVIQGQLSSFHTPNIHNTNICPSPSVQSTYPGTNHISNQAHVADDPSPAQAHVSPINGRENWTVRNSQPPICPSPSTFIYQHSPAYSNVSATGYLAPSTRGSHLLGETEYGGSPVVNLASPSGSLALNLTYREVSLMQYFIQRLCPWVRYLNHHVQLPLLIEDSWTFATAMHVLHTKCL